MIKIYSMYKRSITTDITNYCKTIVWSGDKEQVARKLEITIAYSIFDKNQLNTQIGPGNLIWMLEDGKELFRGYVFDRDIESSNQELTFTAYDYLIYFTKSKGTYNFKNVLPEDIVGAVCDNAGIPVGDIGKSNWKIDLLAKDKTFYEVIMMAYTKVWHLDNGKYNFMPYAEKNKLGLMNMGIPIDNLIITPDINVGNTSYSDAIDSMINKVNVYKSDGTYVGTAWQRDWINMYGILQDVYEAEEGKDAMTVANSMLHGVDRTVKISVLGNTKCTTGWGVNLEIPYISDLSKVTMCIDTDTHTWEVASGKYTMELDLNFETKMKLIEEDKSE
ncbi:hypothetical protein [Clostridium sp. AWRP]|uniref:XkdQ/YqbQ family protein n=1 Tax=Clostridium sp. AWRP TaxID=2212991 RepID=UPI000FD7E515|nr:hypothetical protein [Clostridium sp. AWRP]AZV57922.1 hypothetical protein DMR38_15640 [Clostridium sp. AWRP]